ncbi:Predicted membrane protein [Gordonia bronchialis]|nr:Predicted membrane protein [Gordonia bronchialis]
MKVVATGFLVFAAIVYLFTRYLEHRDGTDVAAWVGYVRAASEAGMVGALADWFAVTALFRHPLGLPIPHTALIRKKKDDIGDQLGEFIEQNFMIPDVVVQRAQQLDLPRRLSTWLADPRNAPQVSDEATRVIGLAAEMLRDEDVEQLIQAALKWAAEPEWAPPTGRILEQLIAEDRLEPVFQLLCDRAHEWALGSQDLIDRVVDKDGPSWTPKFVNNLVGDKIYRELVEFTYKVRTNPDHELRRSMHEFAQHFSQDLQHDPEMIAKFEGIKQELVGRDEVTGAASTAWKTGKAVIEQMLADPNSTLRNTLSDSVIRLAVRIRDDRPLQEKMNGWVARVAHHVASNYSQEIISVITETVRGWDADDTSRKIELQVGRDLQFIRINGTVVGSLAGLAIYTVSVLIFG